MARLHHTVLSLCVYWLRLSLQRCSSPLITRPPPLLSILKTFVFMSTFSGRNANSSAAVHGLCHVFQSLLPVPSHSSYTLAAKWPDPLLLAPQGTMGGVSRWESDLLKLIAGVPPASARRDGSHLGGAGTHAASDPPRPHHGSGRRRHHVHASLSWASPSSSRSRLGLLDLRRITNTVLGAKCRIMAGYRRHKHRVAVVVVAEHLHQIHHDGLHRRPHTRITRLARVRRR